MQTHRAAIFIAQASALALVASLALAAPALADEGGSAPPANDRTFIDEVGVVHYLFDPAQLPGAILQTDVGASRDTGSCEFTASGSGRADGVPQLEVAMEHTFDPATCTRELAVARYDLSAVPQVVLDYLELPEGSEIDENFEEGASSTARLANWFGRMNARVQDPIGIHVSSTTAEHTWNSGGLVAHNNVWGWYTPTGWSRTSSSVINTPTVTNTRGTFQNVAFCNPFAATNTNHSRTEFRGYTSGLWDWGYTMAKSGDCAELLSYHYSVITP